MIPVLLNCYTAIITVAYGIMTRLAVCDLVSSGASPRPEAWPLPADSRWADVSTGCDAVQRAWASLRCPVLQDVLAQQRAETLQMCGRPRCWADVVAASTAAAARREALQKKSTHAVESAFWALETCSSYAASVRKILPKRRFVADDEHLEDGESVSIDADG